LPEGHQLAGLLLYGKIDKNDMFSQLMSVGEDMVGAVTVKEIFEE
jgi:serine/threonine-protein kinase HipA